MKKMFLLVIALVVMSWGQASADLLNFTYTNTDPNNVANLSGWIDATLNPDGNTFTVLSGNITGGTWSGEIVAPYYPGTGSVEGGFRWDNQLLSTNSNVQQLTDGGLMFKTSTNAYINLWGNGGGANYSYYVSEVNNGYTVQNNSGDFNASLVSPLVRSPVPTPIPAAVWLLGSGLAGLLGLRRRFTC